MRLLRVRAFESEQGLPFAGLSSLLSPVADQLDEVPPGQRRALATALGLEAPGAIDRFAAYAATLSLLAAVAGERPVAVLVDDAHWLDAPSSEALIFAARRLGHEGIAMLLASRDEEGARLDTTGLRELRLDGLDVSGTATLLQRADRSRHLVRAGRRAHGVTAGNPLALCELARTLTAAQLSGAEPLPNPLPLGADIADAFGSQIAALPEGTQRALVVVAAADGASTGTLDRALSTLGLSLEALGPAEAASLVAIEGRTAKLRHPLVRRRGLPPRGERAAARGPRGARGRARRPGRAIAPGVAPGRRGARPRRGGGCRVGGGGCGGARTRGARVRGQRPRGGSRADGRVATPGRAPAARRRRPLSRRERGASRRAPRRGAHAGRGRSAPAGPDRALASARRDAVRLALSQPATAASRS